VATTQVGEETLPPRAYDLVRSAYQVITRQGSHRLSLQDVADQAGVSKGMVLYFKSKEHLLLVTMRWALEQTGARIRRRTAGAGDPTRCSPAWSTPCSPDPRRTASSPCCTWT
jgi:TetR/AcrR family transcriptional regulator, fatty acid metabolism regulator protein